MYKFTFNKEQRLSDNIEIRQVYQKGKKINATYANVFFYQNQFSYPRLCISVGKRQISKAVQRNRIKRVIRESFRLHQSKLFNLDIVIVAFKDILTLDNNQLKQLIDTQWKRLDNLRFNFS